MEEEISTGLHVKIMRLVYRKLGGILSLVIVVLDSTIPLRCMSIAQAK
jgi:hypothetical protein